MPNILLHCYLWHVVDGGGEFKAYHSWVFEGTESDNGGGDSGIILRLHR